MPTGSPMLAILRAPADHDIQTYCMNSTLIWIWIFMASIMWLYQNPGLIIIYAPLSISHSTNTHGKGMNPIILPPAIGK